MQAMSMREELHVSAQSHLLKHLAWQPISTDVDAMVVVAFAAVGLAATLYLLVLSSFSEAISAALANLG
jgi:hypothetical protein